MFTQCFVMYHSGIFSREISSMWLSKKKSSLSACERLCDLASWISWCVLYYCVFYFCKENTFCLFILSIPPITTLGFVEVLLQMTLVQKEVGQTFRVKRPSPQVKHWGMQPYVFSVLTDKDYIYILSGIFLSSLPKKSLKTILIYWY